MSTLFPSGEATTATVLAGSGDPRSSNGVVDDEILGNRPAYIVVIASLSSVSDCKIKASAFLSQIVLYTRGIVVFESSSIVLLLLYAWYTRPTPRSIHLIMVELAVVEATIPPTGVLLSSRRTAIGVIVVDAVEVAEEVEAESDESSKTRKASKPKKK